MVGTVCRNCIETADSLHPSPSRPINVSSRRSKCLAINLLATSELAYLIINCVKLCEQDTVYQSGCRRCGEVGQFLQQNRWVQ